MKNIKEGTYALEIESGKHQASLYIDTYYNHLLAYEGYKHEVIDFMGDLSKEGPLLDVGCGTGWFLAMLHRDGWRNLNGLDISPDMLRVACEMVPDATLHESPIEEFSDVSGGYKVIICLGTLHHMPNHSRVADSLSRLLQPGGILIVHEPNEGWFYENYSSLRLIMRGIYSPLRLKNSRFVKTQRRLWATVPPSPHHEDVSVDKLVSILNNAGFVLEATQFQNTAMRVFEGMLCREFSIDRALYRAIRWLDRRLFDSLAGKRAGSVLLRMRKPPAE